MISITVFYFDRHDITTKVLPWFFFYRCYCVDIWGGKTDALSFMYYVELFSGCAKLTKQNRNLQNIPIALNTIPKTSRSFHSCILTFHQVKKASQKTAGRYFLLYMGRREGFRYEATNSPKIADKYKKKII